MMGIVRGMVLKIDADECDVTYFKENEKLLYKSIQSLILSRNQKREGVSEGHSRRSLTSLAIEFVLTA